jgi:hypothetical protein
MPSHNSPEFCQSIRTGRYKLESAILRALEMPDAAARWVRGERIFAGCDEIPMPAHVARQIVAMNRQG